MHSILLPIEKYEGGISADNILVDSEKAVMNVLEAEFALTEIQGCNFHLCQFIMRHISLAGFYRRYEEDADFVLCMRHLAALAYVPADKVVKAFKML